MKRNYFLSALFMVLGEFCIILDAGVIGYMMQSNFNISEWEKVFFWILLALGVLLRFLAEELKK